MKFIFGVAFGLLVTKLCGVAGFAGITPMAIIAALTNSAGGLYLGLAQQYGDETDAGAISILSLNDGPFFTMIAMGTAGMASIPIYAFIATLIPLIIGIIWGNLDDTFRKVAADAMPIITFFMMIPIGAGMSLMSLVQGGMAGLILAMISALTAFLFYFVYQLLLPKNKRNAMGAATVSYTHLDVYKRQVTFCSSMGRSKILQKKKAPCLQTTCPKVERYF